MTVDSSKTGEEASRTPLDSDVTSHKDAAVSPTARESRSAPPPIPGWPAEPGMPAPASPPPIPAARNAPPPRREPSGPKLVPAGVPGGAANASTDTPRPAPTAESGPPPRVMPPLTSASPTPPASIAGQPVSGATSGALALAAEPAANDASDIAFDSGDPRYSDIDDRDETTGGRRVARRRPAGPVRGKVAANDDAPSIGGLIYALEQKPSNRIYRYAAFASAGWALVGAIFAYMSLSAEAATGGWAALLSKPATFLTFAAVVVPIAVIWLLALLGWRAEELRLRSSTMTEVAIRLAEPDRMAEDSIASLGQAVRRQVSFMNEAVGRALGRAGELEALVHSEVAALERSYEENELRIRGLISELVNEREALNSTSTSFNETLRTLGREVPTLIEKLSNQQSNLAKIIQDAAGNLNALETTLGRSVGSLQTELGGRTSELQGVLENYTGALGQALGSRTDQLNTMLGTHGERIQKMLDDRSGELGGALSGRTEAMQKMLEAYTGALATALASRTTQMQSAFADHMTALDTAIANRTTNLQTVFEEYARALDSTLANRAHSLDRQLVERTRALDSAFNERLKLFDQSVQNSTRAIDRAVDDRAKALTGALESHARIFSETIARQSEDLDQSLNHGIASVRRTSENITRQSIKAIESLAGQSDMLKSVSENLLSQINTVTNRFEAQGQTILKAANALESANFKIDHTLQTRHAELSTTLDRMAGKADEFSRHALDYSTTIEGTLSDAEARALAAAEQLRLGAQSHRQLALTEIERVRNDTEAESARALSELKDRLSSVSDEVASQLGSLTNRFSETSEDVRARAQRIADELEREQERMRQEVERLPKTTRESAEAMRIALQDQLRALDQLSSLTSREAQRRDIGLPVAHGGALQPAASDPRTSYGGGRHGSAPPATGSLSSLSETLASELTARGGHPNAAREGQGMPLPPGRGAAPIVADPAHSNWSLGDLLKRASHDEERGEGSIPSPAPARPSTPPAPVATQPFTLNIDVLSRALDQASASAIWSRLRAGQRGIMVRSIYSPEGRAAFDEVARRYPGDASLQNTINRYLADFERILRDTEAKDASGRLAQAHMTSTMGRVYLLLAHASGRIT